MNLYQGWIVSFAEYSLGSHWLLSQMAFFGNLWTLAMMVIQHWPDECKRVTLKDISTIFSVKNLTTHINVRKWANRTQVGKQWKYPLTPNVRAVYLFFISCLHSWRAFARPKLYLHCGDSEDDVYMPSGHVCDLTNGGLFYSKDWPEQTFLFHFFLIPSEC